MSLAIALACLLTFLAIAYQIPTAVIVAILVPLVAGAGFVVGMRFGLGGRR